MMSRVGIGPFIGLCIVILLGGSGCSEKKEVVQKPSEDETEMEKAERELEEEKRKLKMMEEATRLAEAKARIEAEYAEAKRKENEARKKREEAERQKKLAEAKKKAEIEAARAALLGTKLPKFSTAKGADYASVEIKTVTPASLRIVHEAGAATISFADLTDEWQKKVRYDPIEAEQFAKERNQKQAAYKEAVASKKKSEAEQRKKEKEDNARGAIPPEELRLQAQIEKYINLKKNAESEYTRLRSRRDTLTIGSASWNTTDKKLIAINNKIHRYDDEVRRYRALLYEKEGTRIKAEQLREREERRRKREEALRAREAARRNR